jgi:predicted XRE-type DNA-binding protein
VAQARKVPSTASRAPQLGRSSGNVFGDLGLKEEEAENLKIRSELMIELTKLT